MKRANWRTYNKFKNIEVKMNKVLNESVNLAQFFP